MNFEDKDYLDKIMMKKFSDAKNNIEGFNKKDIESIIFEAQRRKKKKIYSFFALSACAVFILLFCINLIFNNVNLENTQNTDNTASLENNNNTLDEGKNDTFTLEYTMNLSSTVDYSDINVLKQIAEYIVIAKVTTIDGAINYSEGLGMYTSVNTIGQIQILQSLKGDLKLNDTIPFIRLGGTIKTSEYIKGLDEKRIYLLQEAQNNGQTTMLDYEYIKEIKDGDIEIEEGKTYLMFICYDQYNQRYEIFGEQYGLREYDIQTETVLNNATNEKESIYDLNLKN